MYELECCECKKEFKHTHPRVKYCSDDCRKMHKISLKENKTYKTQCRTCGKIFTSNNKNKKYCCRGCQSINYNRTNLKSNNNITVKCKVCDCVYLQKSENHIYCSVDCYNSENKDFSNNKFNQSSRITKSNYEYLVRFKVEELINRGIEGSKIISTEYFDFGFTSTLKDKVKERDKWSCQICNSKNKLEVHHIIKVRHRGSSDLDNLITLCTSCHRSIDTLDIEHAVRKCTKNAMINLNIIDEPINNKYKETLEISKIRLERLFKSIDKLSFEGSEDILMQIDDIIDKMQEGY